MNKLYTVMLFLFSALWVQAQTPSVSGKVTASDADNGPLPGVAILVEGTTRGTTTNVEGDYTLALQPGDSVLVFSFIGYKRQRMNVTGRAVVDVTMNPEVFEQEDVVIIGYGTQKKSDLTGSVSSVRGEDLVKVPNNNPVQALQGKVAGVSITSNSGEPGDPPKVRIRGVGSLLSGSNPLYVVDGVFTRDISSINSQDIESIELLKDASAAAIFGVEGSNGVVLITTKRGRDGKPTFSFTAEYGVQNVAKKIKLLNGSQYAQIYNSYNLEQYNPDNVPNTDWQSEVFRKNSPIQNYQFSTSGGTASGNYYFGLGYFGQEGILPNSKYERISARSNLNFNITKNWSIGSNLTIAPSWTRNAPNVIATTYRAFPFITPYRPQGDSIKYSNIPTYGNPLADLEYNSNNYTKIFNAIGNLFSEYKLPFGLKYRINFGYDLTYARNVNFTPIFYVGPTQNSTYTKLSTGRGWKSNTLLDNLLYWNKSFGKHNFDVLGGISIYRNYTDILTANARDISRDSKNLWYVSQGLVQAGDAAGFGLLFRKASYFGRLNYNYDGKYLFTATYRVDGSSSFAQANRYAAFPSVALGWVASQEEFLRDVSWLSNLKLRASVGRLGNQVTANTQLTQKQTATQQPDRNLDPNTQYNLINNSVPAIFGAQNSFLPGSAVGVTANPNIKWETTRQIDAGIEFGFLQNRLTFEADYFNRKSSNVLVPLTTPGYFGNGNAVKVIYNSATVNNIGFEFTAGWNDQVGRIGYRFNANTTFLHNEVTSINSTVQADKFLTGATTNGSFLTRTGVGNSIGEFYGYQADGVYQNQAEIDAQLKPSARSSFKPGDLRYRDLDGDSAITDADRKSMGSPIPKFIFGFSGGISFYGFDLSADFQGQTGNMIYNSKATSRVGPANFEANFADHWTPDHPSNIPNPTVGGSNYQNSTFWLQKGDYLRLRTLTLSYSLPKMVFSRFGMQKASVYVRGTNLATWTKYTGFTPEIGGNNDLEAGIDGGVYPISRVYTAGVTVTF